MPANQTDLFLFFLISEGVGVQRLEARTRLEIIGILSQMLMEIRGLLEEFDVGGTPVGRIRRYRTKRAYGRAKIVIASRFNELLRLLVKRARSHSDYHSETGTAKMTELFDSPAEPAMTNKEVRKITALPFMFGWTVAEWVNAVRDKVSNKILRELRFAAASPRTTQQIITQLFGTGNDSTRAIVGGKERRLVKVSGVLDSIIKDGEETSRTFEWGVFNVVYDSLYGKNSHIVVAIKAVAVLDLKTGVICRARSGALWDAKTGEPLPESPRQEPFPGIPPWHPHCRTQLAPVFAYQDPPADLTYEEWLSKQSEEDQKRVLGPSKWVLWKEGKITMSQLIDQSGRPLTIDELLKLNSGR